MIAKWDSMSSTERTKELQTLWRNRTITDTYEPGSVFKTLKKLLIQKRFKEIPEERALCYIHFLPPRGSRLTKTFFTKQEVKTAFFPMRLDIFYCCIRNLIFKARMYFINLILRQRFPLSLKKKGLKSA